MASIRDKAAKARRRALQENYSFPFRSYKTDELVMDLTRGKAKGAEKVMGRLIKEPSETRAAAIVQQRRRIDTAKTAARATAIQNRKNKRTDKATTLAGISGTPKKKGVSAGVRAAAKKAAAGMKKPAKKKSK